MYFVYVHNIVPVLLHLLWYTDNNRYIRQGQSFVLHRYLNCLADSFRFQWCCKLHIADRCAWVQRIP